MADFNATLMSDIPLVLSAGEGGTSSSTFMAVQPMIVAAAQGGTASVTFMAFVLPDASAPVLSGFSPTTNATLAKYDLVTFDVTDALIEDQFLVTIQVSVYIVSTDTAELAWNGDGWENQYITSTRTAITNGFHFVLRRRAGWPSGGVRVRVRAVDRGGNIGTL